MATRLISPPVAAPSIHPRADFSLPNAGGGGIFGAVRTSGHLVTTAAVVIEQCAVEGAEVDPEVVVAEQRFDTMRRAWELLPELKPLLCEAGRAYAEGGHPATGEGAEA